MWTPLPLLACQAVSVRRRNFDLLVSLVLVWVLAALSVWLVIGRGDGGDGPTSTVLVPVSLVDKVPGVEQWCTDDDLRRWAVDDARLYLDVERGCYVSET